MVAAKMVPGLDAGEAGVGAYSGHVLCNTIGDTAAVRVAPPLVWLQQ